MLPKAPYYMRVSTKKQAEKWSLPAQMEDGKRYYAQKGYQWDDALVFWDDESGATSDRGGLKEFVKELTNGRYDVACFHAVDRFGRNAIDNLAFKKQFDRLGVRLESVTQQVDFTTPEGGLIYGQLSVYAEYFLKNLAKEIKKGKRERAMGGYTNASWTPFGYDRVTRLLPNGKTTVEFIPNKDSEAIKLAYEWYSTGNWSYQDIATELNRRGFRVKARKFRGDMTPTTQIGLMAVRTWLINPFYAGKVVYAQHGKTKDGKRVKLNVTVIDGKHEAVVSQELFERVQQVAPTRYNIGRSADRKTNVYILGRNMARCSICREPLRAGSAYGKRYYRDIAKLRGIPCAASQARIQSDALEATLTPFIEGLRLPPDALSKAESALMGRNRARDVESRRKSIAERRRRLLLAYETSDVMTDDEYKRRDSEMKAELETLGDAVNTQMLVGELHRVAELLRDISTLWGQSDLAQKRDIARALFFHVIVNADERRVVGVIPHKALVPLFDQCKGLRRDGDMFVER